MYLIVVLVTYFFDQHVYAQGWTHYLNDLAGTSAYHGLTPPLETGYPELSWQFTLPAYDIGYVLSGDVDGDGVNEIVTVQADVLYIISADGSVQSTTQLPLVGEFPYVTVLEDANGDEVLDIGISVSRGVSNNGNQQFLIYDGNGTQLHHVIKPVSADGGTEIVSILDQDVIVRYNAGFARDPRGFARWDLDTGTELWTYDMGPAPTYSYSIRDVDNDGSLEMSTGTWTPHNGASGNGTTDGDVYSVIIDEVGTPELVQQYSAGNSNGTLYDHLVQFQAGEPIQLLSFKGYNSSYSGTAQINLRDYLSGSVLHSFTGGVNQSWRYAVGDLDNDGTSEVVTGEWSNQGGGSLYVLDETLQVKASRPVAGALHTVRAIADLNGDGEQEVLTFTRSGDIIAYNAQLDEVWRWSTPDRSQVHNVIVSDNDNDGRLDVTALSTTHIFSFEGMKSSSLIAHYPFDGNANDLSGNNHHGSVNGASLTMDRFGNTQGAFAFDGINDYIEVPTDTDFDNLEEGITLSGWVKRNGNDLSDSFVFSRRPNLGGPMHFTIKISNSPNSGGFSFQWDGVNQPSPGYSVYASENNEYPRLNDGNWHHLAVTFNYASNEDPVLYIDGKNAPGVYIWGDGSHAPVIQNGPILFGKQLSISEGLYNGLLDDLRIYNKALNSQEILALCEEGGWVCNSTTNSSPTAQNLNAETSPGIPVSIQLRGSDSDGDELSYRIVQPPLQGNVALNGALATYTPDVSFSGTDTFTYVTSDGFVDSNEATVTLTQIQEEGEDRPTASPLLLESMALAFENALASVADVQSTAPWGFLESEYDGGNGIKHLGYINAGISDGLGVGFYIDIDDFVGITQEGQAGWVTVWIDASVGIGSGIPLSFGLLKHQIINNEPDPLRDVQLADLEFAGPGLNVAGLTMGLVQGENGVEEKVATWQEGIGFEASVRLFAASENLFRFEMQRDVITDLVNAAVPDAATGVLSDPLSALRNEFIGERSLFLDGGISGYKELYPLFYESLDGLFREFTSSDDNEPRSVAVILESVAGGLDTDGDGYGDRFFPGSLGGRSVGEQPACRENPSFGWLLRTTIRNVGNTASGYEMRPVAPENWCIKDRNRITSVTPAALSPGQPFTFEWLVYHVDPSNTAPATASFQILEFGTEEVLTQADVVLNPYEQDILAFTIESISVASGKQMNPADFGIDITTPTGGAFEVGSFYGTKFLYTDRPASAAAMIKDPEKGTYTIRVTDNGNAAEDEKIILNVVENGSSRRLAFKVPLEEATSSVYQHVVGEATNSEEDDLLLTGVKVNDLYPNPFTNSTQMSYEVHEVMNLSIKVFDVLGREISILESGVKRPGRYQVEFMPHTASKGIYFIRVETDQEVILRKAVYH